MRDYPELSSLDVIGVNKWWFMPTKTTRRFPKKIVLRGGRILRGGKKFPPIELVKITDSGGMVVYSGKLSRLSRLAKESDQVDSVETDES